MKDNDEIERLRAALAEREREIAIVRRERDELLAEVARLRGAAAEPQLLESSDDSVQTISEADCEFIDARPVAEPPLPPPLPLPPPPRVPQVGPRMDLQADSPSPVKAGPAVSTYHGPSEELSLRRVVLSPKTEPPESQFFPATDRRADQRLNCEIELEFLDDSHFFAGLTLDLSRGGLFVATYHVLPVGTLLKLLLDLGAGEPLEVVGEVRWVRPDSPGNERPGLGIAFKELTGAALSKISAYCDEHMPRYIDDL